MHPLVVAAIVVGVIIALAVAAAGIYLAFASADSIRKTAAMMDNLCMAAKQEGDKETVRVCLGYAKDLLTEGLKQSNWVGDVITAAAIIGGLYVVAVYGVPAVAKGLGEAKVLRET
jgi:hypothetical protein